ncbi:hypothetical protein [Pseudomonas sp. zfem005]|uniref:phage tail terminator protein n=1 Tax=Pseudomonas sp. zfem005 TaxID=3078200 RepID=UPI002929AE18|nr:hypothetical protein [Pseudomonas sp. zfem005]MDU9415217.1 hypothetical protein [Pseudomonas sp. zfem005]
MIVSPVVKHLRERCPLFARRVTGGIDWEAIESSAKLQCPAAYVVLGDEDAEPSQSATTVRQDITEDFHVCVVMEQRVGDEKGLAVGDQLDLVRRELTRALVGWEPGEDYDPIQYAGRDLLLLDRAKAVYRFRFFTGLQLGRNGPQAPAETYQEWVEDGLPPLDGIDIDVDYIDPMVDPNLSPRGPDGRVEFKVREE